MGSKNTDCGLRGEQSVMGLDLKANGLFAINYGEWKKHSRSLLVGSQNTNSRVWSQTGS